MRTNRIIVSALAVAGLALFVPVAAHASTGFAECDSLGGPASGRDSFECMLGATGADHEVWRGIAVTSGQGTAAVRGTCQAGVTYPVSVTYDIAGVAGSATTSYFCTNAI